MTPTTAVSTAPRSAEIVYPTTDGRPMGETDLHRNIMFASIESLKLHHRGQHVYVSGNILLFYQPGKRRRNGAKRRPRPSGCGRNWSRCAGS